jgi:hypothetical protein
LAPKAPKKKILRYLISPTPTPTGQKPLAAVEKISKILEIFSTAAKDFVPFVC